MRKKKKKKKKKNDPFYDVVSSSDYIGSNGRMINE
jgi:hypothetical protein